MDYLKTAIPSQLISERGSNLVVINPGSANIRVGLAQQDAPFTLPHCIARYTSQVPKPNVQDQFFRCSILKLRRRNTWSERRLMIFVPQIASLLKIPFLDEEVANSSSFQRKMGHVDGYNPQNVRKESVFAWTDVYEKQS
ncbi:actin-related protein 9-like [Syzygium oleosum]|uniref:actin-related protein 9-like n=1 Tax=Syzygium oleosum TaxID=219896 RepID=UPI0024BA0BF4|nr:actin-related protein 9-like [Syzygium oleosum]